MQKCHKENNKMFYQLRSDKQKTIIISFYKHKLNMYK